ncbi:hypothetical protein [Planococcus sp. CAU13]|uniref:hypothetical protein n=1 Tax=Planococcus sp. CAU13 TaxID=1541197 RepID=UPI0005300005|nr:hypothetical protein [Planococcus sp. CAU13]
MKQSKGSSMNPRVFFSVLFVIITGWFAVGAYASSQHLEKPVFLDHYIDDYAQEALTLQFYYITNKGDRNTINYIMLGYIPGYVNSGYIDEFFDPFMEEAQYIQRYGLHDLRSVTITLDAQEINKSKENMTFDEITVYFSDGSSMVADIGEIVLHPIKSTDNPLLSQELSASSPNSYESVVRAEEKLTITSLQPHMPADDLNSLTIHLLGEDEIVNEYNLSDMMDEKIRHEKGSHYMDLNYPIELDEEEAFVLSIRNQEKVKYVLKSWMMVEALDENNKELSFPLYLSCIPELAAADIKAILEQKGQGNK